GGVLVVARAQAAAAGHGGTTASAECVAPPGGRAEAATAFGYYIPPTAEGQEALLADHPELETWVEAVRSAKSRTGDNLGTDYPLISEALWTAVQNATSGAMSVSDALAQAQAEAEAAVNG